MWEKFSLAYDLIHSARMHFSQYFTHCHLTETAPFFLFQCCELRDVYFCILFLILKPVFPFFWSQQTCSGLVLCILFVLTRQLGFSCELNEKVVSRGLSTELHKAALTLTLPCLMENVNNYTVIEGYTWAERGQIVWKSIYHLKL